MLPLCQDQLSVRLITCQDAAAEEPQGADQGNDSQAELFMDDGRDDLFSKLATSDLRAHSAGRATAPQISPQSQPSLCASTLNAQDAHTSVSPPLLQSHQPRGNREQGLLSNDLLIDEQADKEGAGGPPSPDEDNEEILRGGIGHESQEILQDASPLESSWGSLAARAFCDPTPSEHSLQFSRVDCFEESQLMADFPSEEDLPAADGCRLESYCQRDSKGRIDQALYLLSQTPTPSAQEEAYANNKRLMERALVDLSECMSEDDCTTRDNLWWCPLPREREVAQSPQSDLGNSIVPAGATQGSQSESLLRGLNMWQEEKPLDMIVVHESDSEDNDYGDSWDPDRLNKAENLKITDTQNISSSKHEQESQTGDVRTDQVKNCNDDYEQAEAAYSDVRKAPPGTHAVDIYGKSGDNQVIALPSASVATIKNNKVVPAIKYTHTSFLDGDPLDGLPSKEVQHNSRFRQGALSTKTSDKNNTAAHEDNTQEWQEGGTAPSKAPRQLSEGQVSEEEDSESLLKGVVFDSIIGFPVERLPSQEPN